MAGVNRSQVNRWSRGENRPSHDAVRRLAAAVWREHPRLARELVEASGYPWTEPAAVPKPSIPADVLAVIRKRYSPEQQREVIEMLESLSGPPEEEGSERRDDDGYGRAG